MKTKRQRVVLGLLTVGLLVVALSALLTRASPAVPNLIWHKRRGLSALTVAPTPTAATGARPG